MQQGRVVRIMAIRSSGTHPNVALSGIGGARRAEEVRPLDESQTGASEPYLGYAIRVNVSLWPSRLGAAATGNYCR